MKLKQAADLYKQTPEEDAWGWTHFRTTLDSKLAS
jgi:hypothetical protein